MQVQVAQVLQRAQVQRAVQVLAHRLAVEHLHLLAHAAPLGFVGEGLQFGHVRRLHGRVQVAVLEVAVDGIAFDPLLDDVVAAKAQLPDEIVHVIAQALAHLFAHGLVTRQAAGDLAAVAPAGAPADTVGFDDGHLQAALGQFHRAGHAGEAATDDHHVDLDRALQGRVLGGVVQAGGVVGGAALGGAVVEGCIHGCVP